MMSAPIAKMYSDWVTLSNASALQKRNGNEQDQEDHHMIECVHRNTSESTMSKIRKTIECVHRNTSESTKRETMLELLCADISVIPQSATTTQ